MNITNSDLRAIILTMDYGISLLKKNTTFRKILLLKHYTLAELQYGNF